MDTVSTSLSEIIVTSNISNKKLSATTENIQILTKDDISNTNGTNYNTLFNRVPGVFMQSGSLNTNRITIRGIGARSPFGTTSIRAYVGEIPITDGNGNSSIEDWELNFFSNIEIHKGPAASSFGVGLGGTIILKPVYSDFSSSKVTAESTHGSFGLHKSLLKGEVSAKKVATHFLYSNTQSDGYRDNNEYDRDSFILSSSLDVSSKDKLQILGNYTNLKAFIPSSVNLDTYLNSPKSAAPTWDASEGFEDTESFLAGISWEHRFSSTKQLYTTIFTTNKKNYEPRPFNILKEESTAVGLRSRLTGTIFKKLQWGFGGEFFYDSANINTFENDYQDFPIGTGSVLGAELSDLKEQRSYYNLFGEASYLLSNKWSLNLGVNLNKTFYDINDQFNIGEESNTGDFNFNAIVSPKLGLLYKVNNQLSYHVSVAHGFAPPTTEETLLPEGDINPDLKPEKGWNFELGTLFSFFKNRLYGDFNLYLLSVSDLLVSRRAENESLFAINAGKTNHFGGEGNINYSIYTSNQLTVSSFINFSVYQYYFDDFTDDSADFSGNKLTGVPSGLFNSGLSVKTDFGIYASINYQYVGRIPANDANTVFSDTYQLVNAQLGFHFEPFKKLNFKTFLGINNIFDTKYISQLQVNASGFGGNAPRYYYAGNPVNYYGGVSLSYLIK